MEQQSGASRSGCSRDRLIALATKGVPLRASGSDGVVLCMQELPPREHRQIGLVGAFGRIFRGLCAVEIEGCADGALSRRGRSLNVEEQNFQLINRFLGFNFTLLYTCKQKDKGRLYRGLGFGTTL